MGQKSFPHRMLEEIYYEPVAIKSTLGKLNREAQGISCRLGSQKIKFLYITGSGTSYHAGLAGQYLLSTLTKIPVSTILASEFSRWTPPVFPQGTWLAAISQSGESVDVLTAAREAANRGVRILGVTNTEDSTLVRISDEVLITAAGIELAVTATKTFISQLAALFFFSLKLAQTDNDQIDSVLRTLFEVPEIIEGELGNIDSQVLRIVRRFKDKNFYFILGSGPNYAIALEGALKMKEASNVFAEGFATREFLHGPQQLVNKETPIIAITARNEKASSIRLLERFQGFNAPIITISQQGEFETEKGIYPINLKREVPPILTPLLYVVPLQLYAYHNAVLRGYNPDQPEKLAKVVKEI
ncbi:SIS domain-containing protein [[Eubacterium] cellulosolvens]